MSRRRKTAKAQKREEAFSLHQDDGFANLFCAQEKAPAGRTEDPVLFEKLRQLRLKLAQLQKYRAYQILSDKTLHELACYKPTTLAAFGSIYGIGETRRDLYGPLFIDEIKRHMASFSIG